MTASRDPLGGVELHELFRGALAMLENNRLGAFDGMTPDDVLDVAAAMRSCDWALAVDAWTRDQLAAAAMHAEPPAWWDDDGGEPMMRGDARAYYASAPTDRGRVAWRTWKAELRTASHAADHGETDGEP